MSDSTTSEPQLSPSDRYRNLIHFMGERYRFARGWKAKVAGKLGVHPSYLGRVLSGEVEEVGVEIIERACERLRIKRDFFFAEKNHPYPDHYRYPDDYLVDEEREKIVANKGDWHPPWELERPQIDQRQEIRAFGLLGMHVSGLPRDFIENRGRVPTERIRALADAVLALPVFELAQKLQRDPAAPEAQDDAFQLARLASDLLHADRDYPFKGEVDIDEWVDETLAVRAAARARRAARKDDPQP